MTTQRRSIDEPRPTEGATLALTIAAVLIVTWAGWSIFKQLAGDQGGQLPQLPAVPNDPLPLPNTCPRCPHCGEPIDGRAGRWPLGHDVPAALVRSNPVRSLYDAKGENGPIGAPVEQPGTVGRPIIGGPIAPDGKTQVAIDLPTELRTRNRGGSDGAGLCVFSSIGHAARFQNEDGLKDFQRFMWSKRGGGYPSKVDAMIKQCAPDVRYLQYEGNSPEMVKLAIATGRMPSTTYNANHMVNTVHADDSWCCVLDNNYVGERELRWFKPREWQRLYQAGGGGWTVVLLAPRPPAPPYTLQKGR